MLLLILAVLGVAAFVFRSYIHAFILAKTTTAEEREQMLSQQKEHTQKELDDKGIVVRDLTEEEQQKLANNELSEEEAINLILGVLELPEELHLEFQVLGELTFLPLLQEVLVFLNPEDRLT